MNRHEMGKRHLFDIRDSMLKKLGMKPGSIVAREIEAALSDAQVNGIRLAASVAQEYDKVSSHPYLVSDCIMGKLNVLKGKPRRNEAAVQVEQVLASLERRVAGVEGTMRFLTLGQVHKTPMGKLVDAALVWHGANSVSGRALRHRQDKALRVAAIRLLKARGAAEAAKKK